MPLPEGYLPREGDVLSVKVGVEHDVAPGSAYIFVRVIDKLHEKFALPAKKLLPNVSLARRTWREGETVVHKRIEKFSGTVVSLHNDHVVVALNKHADLRGSVGGLRIFHCNELDAHIVDKLTAEDVHKAPAEPPEFDVAGADVVMAAPLTGPMTTTAEPILTLEDESDGQ